MMPKAHPIHALRFAAVMALGLAAGCQSLPLSDLGLVRHFKAPDYESHAIRRVVVVPFHHAGGDQKAIQTVTTAFVQKLQELGKFEVVYQPDVLDDVDEEVQLWVKGEVDVAVLNKVSAKYQADAFCFGAITQYRAYAPPVLGVKVGFVAVKRGVVVWQADGVFDGKQNVVANAARRYYKDLYEKDNYFMGTDVVLKSMKHFAEFVGQEMVATLDDRPLPGE